MENESDDSFQLIDPDLAAALFITGLIFYTMVFA